MEFTTYIQPRPTRIQEWLSNSFFLTSFRITYSTDCNSTYLLIHTSNLLQSALLLSSSHPFGDIKMAQKHQHCSSYCETMNMEDMPTLPTSPCKRRQEMRLSEESEGMMSIHEYLAKADAYRVGAPETLRPMPLLNLQLSQNSPLPAQLDYIQSKVVEIFASHEVSYSCIDIVSRTTVGGGQAAAQETVLVTCRQDTTRSWGEVARQCARFFFEQGFPQLQIEIVHLEKFFLPFEHPLRDDHPVLRDWNWETVGKEVTKTMRYHLTGLWNAIGVYNYGRTLATAVPTIVVTVDQGAIADWSSMTKILVQILSRYGMGYLQVEFTPGQVSLPDGKTIPRIIPVENLPRQPVVGASIGIHHDTGAGTLGGFVVLTKGNQRLYCGLTTHHVVRPSDKLLAARHNQNGIKPGQPDQSTATTIVYPAQDDLMETIEYHQKVLDHAQRDIAKAQAEINSGLDSRHNQATVTWGTTVIDQEVLTLQHLQTLQQSPILGKVIASSGKHLRPNGSLLDWALINITNQAAFTPNFGYAHPGMKQARFMASATTPIFALGDMKAGAWYSKKRENLWHNRGNG